MDVHFRERPPEVFWGLIPIFSKRAAKNYLLCNSYLKRENYRTDGIQKHFAIAWFKGVSLSALLRRHMIHF